ncbi:type 2 periplasmic-binding domain-containing protein [Jatrophihabitans fulvus]
MTKARTRRRGVALAALAVAAVGLSACGSDSDGGGGGSKTISVVGFSVIESVVDDLAEDFAKTDEGKGFAVNGSYGASGDQSKAVAAGQKADFVEFSVEPDMTRLVDAGKVSTSWNAGKYKGIVSQSVVVLAVRKGNPKKITGWDDLVKPGIKIVTADPTRSGAAKWNLLGAYAHGLGSTKDAAAARTYLGKFIKNVSVFAESGRKATEAFSSGQGDVLITYEDEAILAKQAGEDLDYVIPDDTFLIQNPGAVTTNASPVAKKFLTYITSEAGQKIFASDGFRPLDNSVDPGTVEGANDPSKPFPAIEKITTVDDLGGWDAVNKVLFDDGALVPTLQGS